MESSAGVNHPTATKGRGRHVGMDGAREASCRWHNCVGVDFGVRGLWNVPGGWFRPKSWATCFLAASERRSRWRGENATVLFGEVAIDVVVIDESAE